MKRLRLGAIIAVALAAVVAVPSSAIATTGERINLLTGAPATFDAGAPFFVRHGWCFEPQDRAQIALGRRAGTTFELLIDDAPITGVSELRNNATDDAGNFCIFLKNVTFDFPSGLPAGDHHFVGNWYLDGSLFATRDAVITFIG